MIPKIIWTYWDKPEIPKYIQDCLNTWKYHCKNNWSINISEGFIIMEQFMETEYNNYL